MRNIFIFFSLCYLFSAQASSHAKSTILWLSNAKTDPSQLIDYSSNASTTIRNTSDLLIASLPQYHFDIEFYRNATISQLLKKLPNSCAPNRIKTPERLKNSIYSIPLSVTLDFRLYYRGDVTADFIPKNALNKENKLISLAALFKAKPKHTLAIDNGRSLGQFLDKQVAKLSADNLVIRNSVESTTSLIKMLLKNRIDYIIDYPTAVNAVVNKLPTATALKSLEIVNSPGYIIGYVACSKGRTGQKTITDINLSLRKLYLSADFYHVHTRYLESTDIANFNQVYQKVFKVNIPTNKEISTVAQ